MQELKKMLLNKWQQGRFAPCYHLTQLEVSHDDQLSLWMRNLLKEYVNLSQPKISLENCLDILFIASENKNYQVEELSELFHFQESRPLQLKHKFVVITDAHKLNELAQNKLLKILEEPQKFISLFLLNPMGKKLLPTVESRMLKFRLKFNQPSTPLMGQAEIQTLFQVPISLSEFIEKFNTDNQEEKLYQSLLGFELPSYSYYSQLTRLMQWAQLSNTFHNSSSERLAQTYEFLTQHLGPQKPQQKTV